MDSYRNEKIYILHTKWHVQHQRICNRPIILFNSIYTKILNTAISCGIIYFLLPFLKWISISKRKKEEKITFYYDREEKKSDVAIILKLRQYGGWWSMRIMIQRPKLSENKYHSLNKRHISQYFAWQNTSRLRIWK